MSGAKMPPLTPVSYNGSCEGRSSTYPCCFQCTKSADSYKGTPGKKANDELTK